MTNLNIIVLHRNKMLLIINCQLWVGFCAADGLWSLKINLFTLGWSVFFYVDYFKLGPRTSTVNSLTVENCLAFYIYCSTTLLQFAKHYPVRHFFQCIVCISVSAYLSFFGEWSSLNASCLFLSPSFNLHPCIHVPDLISFYLIWHIYVSTVHVCG